MSPRAAIAAVAVLGSIVALVVRMMRPVGAFPTPSELRELARVQGTALFTWDEAHPAWHRKASLVTGLAGLVGAAGATLALDGDGSAIAATVLGLLGGLFLALADDLKSCRYTLTDQGLWQRTSSSPEGLDSPKLRDRRLMWWRDLEQVGQRGHVLQLIPHAPRSGGLLDLPPATAQRLRRVDLSREHLPQGAAEHLLALRAAPSQALAASKGVPEPGGE